MDADTESHFEILVRDGQVARVVLHTVALPGPAISYEPHEWHRPWDTFASWVRTRDAAAIEIMYRGAEVQKQEAAALTPESIALWRSFTEEFVAEAGRG
jgi:hypothetical protein